MYKFKLFAIACFVGLLMILSGCGNAQRKDNHNSHTEANSEARSVWTPEEAQNWYDKQPWLVGANYNPASAINELEMWQAETFDTAGIRKELGWAQSLGMNTMRVYLHDLAYGLDTAGFLQRMDVFLRIASDQGIRPLFVIFDSCWDPFPKPGKQHAPKPHVHNSGWVQSPGLEALKDSSQYERLERYVKGVVGYFASDDRILGWDVWNEPDNTNGSSYGSVELPNKVDYVMPLLKKTFQWARDENPSQPLTSGIWAGDWASDSTLKPIERMQLSESDIISFHNYDKPADFEKRIKQLEHYQRPLICTEYMARPQGSTFETFLPIGKKYRVGMINWGFVSGKTQTIYPWDSWSKKYDGEPPVWFHDIFRGDGTPYRQQEVDFIRSVTKK